MTNLYLILFGIMASFALIYSVLYLAGLYKDYTEAEKAHKKLMDENNYYL